MCSLVKYNIICWFGVVSSFILAPYICNLTSWWWNPFLLFFYLFSIIFLAKGKTSKSIDLFLSHIGPKRFWPIRLQDFKSNISLEQSDEIVYFFACWHEKLRVDGKILGWVWSKIVAATLVTWWMVKLSWFFTCWCKFRKVTKYFNNLWVVVARNGHGTLFLNVWMNLADFMHANIYSSKLKVTLIVIGWTWSNMGVSF